MSVSERKENQYRSEIELIFEQETRSGRKSFIIDVEQEKEGEKERSS